MNSPRLLACLVFSIASCVVRAADAPPVPPVNLIAPPGRLISDLACALPATAWTDADSNVHKPIAPRPEGRLAHRGLQ